MRPNWRTTRVGSTARTRWLSAADFTDHVFAGERWTGRRFVDCRFIDADLRGLVTERCEFTECDFTGADLGESHTTAAPPCGPCVFQSRHAQRQHAPRPVRCSARSSPTPGLRPLTITDTDPQPGPRWVGSTCGTPNLDGFAAARGQPRVDRSARGIAAAGQPVRCAAVRYPVGGRRPAGTLWSTPRRSRRPG